MNLQGFGKIATNCEILIQIYKFLNFADQLRLSRVSKSLQHVFETYMWTETYRTLIVNKNVSDCVVLTNETGANRLRLTPQEFQEFLSVYGDKVQELTENRISPPLDLRQFPNLSSLSYIDMTIPNAHLELIAQYYPNLQNLQLCCFSQEDRGFIVIGRNWHVHNLLQMKNLRRLKLHNDEYAKMKYRHFRKIVTGLPIKSLKLRVSVEPTEIIWPSQIKADDIPANSIQLKELDIEASFDPQKLSLNFTKYLTYFEHLLHLSIKFSDIVTDEILAIIAGNCKQLASYHISLTSFAKIRSFALGPKVTELTLLHCRGLAVANIKQLLTTTELVKFSCRNTDYEGSFEDFQISPTIQSLDLDGVSTNEFRLAYDGNANLKELTWYHALYNDHREIVTGVPLASCTGLHTLNMREGQMALETVLQVKSLRKLLMPHPAPFLSWSYILDLLKYSPLTDLTIGESEMAGCPKMPSEVSVEGSIRTQVLRLQIPLDIFEVALDFWLDLFCCNAKLKLVCWPFYPVEMDFLGKLIDNRNFPRRLKTIDVCGFKTNCNDLRTNLDDTVWQLKDCTAADCELDMHRIVLCRK